MRSASSSLAEGTIQIVMNNDLDSAIALHKMGKLDEAEKLYLRIIETDKNNFTILQLLGTLYLQKKILIYQRNFCLKV